MAEWNKGKVLPSAINGGQEFTTKDNLAVNELNAIVNNSFYASNISETSIAKADSAVATSKLAEEKIDNFIKTGGDSVVTLNGVPQVTWSADFAESERQKSKNLFNVFGDYTKGVSYGVANYSVSQDGVITTTNNYSTSALKGWEIPVKSNATYTIQANFVSSVDAETRCYYYTYDGTSYTLGLGFDVQREQKLTFTTLGNTKSIVVGFASHGGESKINKIQVEEGSVATEYQPYNGEIVHEKQLNEVAKYVNLIYNTENLVNISDSTLTELNRYFDLFLQDPKKIYDCNIGLASNTNFKQLVGTPSGMGNYVVCYIKNYGITLEGCQGIFEIMAYDLFAYEKIAIGYIFKNGYGDVYFTGWDIIGG